jgi:hypothetical protein
MLALALACAGAPAAMSASVTGGNAFGELTEKAQQATETTPVKTTSTAATESGSTSNSKTVIILALVAAVVLLVAIAFVIARDARKVAPVGDGPLGVADGGRASAARLRKRRAKAKAARRQRKRNR